MGAIENAGVLYAHNICVCALPSAFRLAAAFVDKFTSFRRFDFLNS